MRRILAGLAIAAVIALPVINFASPAGASSAVAKQEAPAVQLVSSPPPTLVGELAAGLYHYRIPRWHAFVWALEHIGQPYVFGACGPFDCNGYRYGFDCSGLIYASYRAIGWPYFGRDTYDMLGYGLWSGRLVIISLWQARAGDLAFYGTGHVEMFVKPGWSYGALNSSLPVGFHRWSWYGYPTMLVHVRGAG